MTIMHLVLHVRHIGNYFMKLREEIATSNFTGGKPDTVKVNLDRARNQSHTKPVQL